MSGFHPVLGLLAVAVCISFTKTTPFPLVQKDPDTDMEPLKPSQLAFVMTAKDDPDQESDFYRNGKRSSLNEAEERQSGNNGNSKNSEFIHQDSSFNQASYLKRAYGGAFYVKTGKEGSENGNLGKKSPGGNSFLPRKEESNPEYSQYSDHEPSNNGKKVNERNNGGGILEPNKGIKVDVSVRSSLSEEECDDGEQTAETGYGHSTVSPGGNETSEESQEDEDCATASPVTDEGDQNPSTGETVTTASTTNNDSYPSTSGPASKPDSGGSNNGEVPGSSEECDDSQQGSHEDTVATTPSTRKPNNEDASSGSLNLDSGIEDLDFSDDRPGESTEITW